MIVIECQQGTQPWLEARAGATTASRFREARERVGGLDEKQQAYIAAIKAGSDAKDAAAIAGYKGKPTGAWVEKALSGARMDVPSSVAIKYACLIALERIAHQPLDETFVTWQMRRGQDEEPNARLAYEVKTGSLVLESGVVLTDDRLYGYSTDGFIGDDGMVEIKTPAAPEKVVFTWTKPSEVVDEYRDQIQGGLWITGRQWCDLIIWTPWLRNIGKELYIQRFERDEAYIEALEADLWDFQKLARGFELDLRRTDAPIDGEPVATPDDAPQVLSAVMRAPVVNAKPKPLDLSTLLPESLPF